VKVLVTGAQGFIGSNIVCRLIDAGHVVRALDAEQGQLVGVEAITGDVSDPDTCQSACSGIDAIIHGAAVHHVENVVSNPLRALEVNVSGTLKMLRAAVDQRVGKFVYLSTAKIYGDPPFIPSKESDYPEPIDIYALSKFAGEHYCRLFHDSAGLDVAVIRPFSVYGPGQRLDTGYVGMLLESLITKRPLRFPGRPDFVRDFVHVADVVRLCIQVATGSLSGMHVFNAGTGSIISLAGLVELANKIVGVSLSAEYSQPRPKTIARSHAAMSTVADHLGFKPEISLPDGLRQTIEWFNHPHAAGSVGKS